MGLKGMFLIQEAPNEVDETIHEPTEDDAEVKSDKKDDEEEEQINNNDSDDNEDDVDDEEIDSDDNEDDEESDDEIDDPEIEKSDDENTKKYKLYEDYEKLLVIAEELNESLTHIDISSDEKIGNEVLNTLSSKIDDNVDKMNFVLVNSFDDFSYKKLLTIYLYCKNSLSLISELLNELLK